MKKHVYTALGALSALLALVLLVFFVITLIPVGIADVRATEQILVSSSPTDATETNYHVQVRGRLLYEGDGNVELDGIVLQVAGDGGSERVRLDGFTLVFRKPYDVFYEWESPIPFDRVDAVYLVRDGEQIRLENTEESILGSDSLVSIVLAIAVSLLSLSFFKQMYYIHQEEEMKKRAEN